MYDSLWLTHAHYDWNGRSRLHHLPFGSRVTDVGPGVWFELLIVIVSDSQW